MLILRGQLLFGTDAFLLRNAARDVLRYPLQRSEEKPVFTIESFSRCIGMPASECLPVLLSMVEEGWLSRDAGDFAAEQRFIQLGAARVGKKALKRAKAEQLLATIVSEARTINREQDGNCDYVREVAVFGSFLDPDKHELGDLDIAYATYRRKSLKRTKWNGWADFWKTSPEGKARIRLK